MKNNTTPAQRSTRRSRNRRRPSPCRRIVGPTLLGQQLEDRMLLAGDGFAAWHNFQEPTDVNVDGRVSAADAVIVIGELRRNGSRSLTLASPQGAEGESSAPTMYYDVNADNYLSALDALLVISRLRAEGENGTRPVEFRLSTFTETLSSGQIVRTPVSSVAVGAEFVVNVTVQDTRMPGSLSDPDDLGVFQAYMDFIYGDAVSTVAANTNSGDNIPNSDPAFPFYISFGPDGSDYNDLLSVKQGSDNGSGLIDEVGSSDASAGGFFGDPPGGDAVSLYTVRFRADAVPVTAVNDSATVSKDSGAVPIAVLSNDALGQSVFTTNKPEGNAANPFPNGGNVEFGVAETSPPPGRTLGPTFPNPDTEVGFGMANITITAPGSALTVTGVTQPAKGVVTFTPTSVSFNPNGQFPNVSPGSSEQVTFTYTVSNGLAGAANLTQTATVTVTVVDNAPIVTTTATALAYTENAAPTAIDPGLTVTDSDSANLVGATVAITSGLSAGQDVLAFTNQLGITGTYNAATGVLTLTGTTTVANYQTALRSVTYQNTSENPSTTPRVVTFTVNDGTFTGSATRTINVTAVNDAPVNTVPGPQTSPINEPLVFSQSRGNRISISDADAGSNNVQVDLSVNSGTLSVTPTAGVTIAGNGTADVTLTGSISAINTALNGTSLTYTPNTDFVGADTLTVRTNDLGNTGGPAQITTSTVTINVVDNVPIVRTTSTPLAYTENAPATAIDPGLTVIDTDSANLVGATVSITSGFAGSEDVLAFTNQLGITGNYNAATGVLTLTGTATVANYQTALRSVTYRNTSENPSTTQRVVSFTVNDGMFTGTGTRAINVASVNDAPVNMVPGSQITLINQPLVFNQTNNNRISISDADAGSNNVQLDLSVNSGTLSLAPTMGVTIAGNGTSSVTLTGPISAINTALNGTGLTYQPNTDFVGSDTLTVRTNDLGNSGGPAQVTTSTVAINVIAFVPTTFSGFVYIDADAENDKDPEERGIGGIRVTLTGTDFSGNAVNRETVTSPTGFYEFTDLVPNQAGSSYIIMADQPVFLRDGGESIGTVNDPGAGQFSLTSPGNDTFELRIGELAGVNTGNAVNNFVNNNFGELGVEPRFVDTWDLLASTPRGGVLFGIDTSAASQQQWFIPQDGWEGFRSATLTLSNDLSTATFTAVDSTGTSHTRTFSTSDNTRIRIQGSEGNRHVVRIYGDDNDPMSFFGTPNNNAGGEGEGSDYARSVDSVFSEGWDSGD